MATILKNKKSTTGNPYVYYTVDATPSNRTTTSIDISIKITSNLASSSSVLGATYDLTCYLTFNGTEYSIKIKDNESWSGTTKHTKTKKITVNNLSPSANVIENITFRALGYNSSSDRAGYTTKTACSNLTIPIGHVNPTDAYFTLEESEPSLIEAGIPNDLFVANLSNKKYTIGATFYDDAEMWRVWVINVGTNISSAYGTDNPLTCYFNFQEKPMRRGINGVNTDKVPMYAIVFDSLDGSTALKPQDDEYYYYDFVYYDKLLLNEQTSKVKRFGQTTGNVRANLYGQFFRGIIGNINQVDVYTETTDTTFVNDKDYYILNEDKYTILYKDTDYHVGDSITEYFDTVYEISSKYKPTIQYKIWSGSEEPTNYNYTIPRENIVVSSDYVQASGVYQETIYYYKLINSEYTKLIYDVDYYVGDPIENEVYTLNHTFKVEDYEIGSNVETDVNYFNPELSYKVKFQLSDNFTTYESLEKTINVGKAIFTEYRDRVDFEKLTVKGEEIKENNVITASLSASESISGTGGQKVIFNKSVIAGNRLSLSNGNVVIGKGISKVKVSAEIYFSGSLTAGDRVNFNIYKNYDTDNSVQITTSQLVVYKTLGSVSSIPVLIEVEEGDTICLVARNRTSGTGTIYYLGTNLTVEAV